MASDARHGRWLEGVEDLAYPELLSMTRRVSRSRGRAKEIAMNRDSDVPAEIGTELDSLLVDSTLAAIEADAPLSQIEIALRSLGQFIQKADPIRRAIVREAAIRKLRAAGVAAPAGRGGVATGG